MGKTRITELSITELKITYEDKWLESWVKDHGDSIATHPNTLFLTGDAQPLIQWFTSRGYDWRVRAEELIHLYFHMKKHGQIHPIQVYPDNRIYTGHKRTGVLYTLGKKTVKAQRVSITTKL